MATRRTSLSLLALLAALAAAARPAVAQVAPPSMVGDGDDEATDDTPPPPEPAAPATAPAPDAQTQSAHPERRPRGAGPESRDARDERNQRNPPPTATQTAAPTATPTATPTANPNPNPTATPTPNPTANPTPNPTDLPPPPPPPAAPADLAHEIAPVHATWQGLVDAWNARRAALREQDAPRAQAAEAALLDAKKDLAIENLDPFAAAEVRDAFRSLHANLPSVALREAELAVKLAPDLPDAHLAVARARIATAPGDLLPALAALRDALAAAAREPHTARAFVGDVLTAAIAAALAASAATLLLLFARRVRPLLHDFHHLPIVRAGAPIQAALLGAVLLAMPLAFGLGAFATLATLALVAWAYLETRERVVASVALLAVVALPSLAGLVARETAWTGTLAETVHDLEHGAVSDADAAALLARAEEPGTPAPLLAALGRHFKRRGDLARAEQLYDAAARAGDRAPELLVDQGNVRFLRGDLEGAKAAYLTAADRATDVKTLAAAHYDLAKVYFRTSDLEKGQAARERAEKEDGAFLRRAVPEEDFSANHHLVDVPVPGARIRALVGASATGDAVASWLRGRLAGALPPVLWPWGAVAFVALLWPLGVLLARARPSRPCERCGRPACARCDAVSGAQCGQCVNVYGRRAVVDARDRLRKEAQVRRRAQANRFVTRALSVLGAGAGQVWAGAAASGFALSFAVAFFAFVIGFWRGLMPPPYPSSWVLAGKLGVALPLGISLYALAVRDAFRRTR